MLQFTTISFNKYTLQTTEMTYNVIADVNPIRRYLVVRKTYETPKAEKYYFNYSENVVASGFPPWYDVNVKGGKTGSASNACFTHNTDNVWTDQTCYDNAEKKF